MGRLAIAAMVALTVATSPALAWQEAPPAVSPAPPASPTVPGPYMIFFEWAKADITPEGAAILNAAAAAFRQSGSAQILIAAHADRSGSPSRNLDLSQRRADAVRAHLVGSGIADAGIATTALGEERPLVDTQDGTREPQNRRVEISFGARTP